MGKPFFIELKTSRGWRRLGKNYSSCFAAGQWAQLFRCLWRNSGKHVFPVRIREELGHLWLDLGGEG